MAIAQVAVTAPLPVLGLFGIEDAVEVEGRAPLEDSGP